MRRLCPITASAPRAPAMTSSSVAASISIISAPMGSSASRSIPYAFFPESDLVTGGRWTTTLNLGTDIDASFQCTERTEPPPGTLGHLRFRGAIPYAGHHPPKKRNLRLTLCSTYNAKNRFSKQITLNLVPSHHLLSLSAKSVHPECYYVSSLEEARWCHPHAHTWWRTR